MIFRSWALTEKFCGIGLGLAVGVMLFSTSGVSENGQKVLRLMPRTIVKETLMLLGAVRGVKMKVLAGTLRTYASAVDE